MGFPQTRLTLIQRLANEGGEADWTQFLQDYWRPLCRFAERRCGVQPADADDIVGATIEVLVKNRLLVRWSENRNARLRTLLCSVIRKQLANFHRKHRRERVDLSLDPGTVESIEDDAAFRDLWNDEILERSLEALRSVCLKEGKIDQFRVLYGRVCESMTHAEVARCLAIPETTAQAWYQQSRDRLAECLREQVVRLARQYAPTDQFDAEFQQEWNELGEYLKSHGGLEAAIRRSHKALDDSKSGRWKLDSSRLTTLTQKLRSASEPS